MIVEILFHSELNLLKMLPTGEAMRQLQTNKIEHIYSSLSTKIHQ